MARPRKVILLVDGDERRLSTRRFLLETRGFAVLAVESAVQALEVLADAHPGRIDCMLTQLQLPEMGGVELARRAKEMCAWLPVAIVSERVECLAEHVADVFLPKGASSAAELVDRMKMLTARKRGPKQHPQNYSDYCARKREREAKRYAARLAA